MESVEVVLDDALAVEIQVEEAPVEDDVVVALKNYCRLNLMSFIMEYCSYTMLKQSTLIGCCKSCD